VVFQHEYLIYFSTHLRDVFLCNTILQDERLSFDQQISSLERTVQLKKHDLEELVLLSSKFRRKGCQWVWQLEEDV